MITGVHYSIKGNVEEAKIFIKKAIKKGKPKFIQTDMAMFYPKAFKKLFYSNKIGGLVVEHKIQNVSKTKIHNYKIETIFMKIKDRVKDFRGLKSLWSAPIIMIGLTIQHNFIEEHTTTGKQPCCLAGQDLNLGDNQIEVLPPNVFQSLTNLKELYLKGNKIKRTDLSLSNLREINTVVSIVF